MGEATKIRDLEHLILHAGGDVAVAREALRALQRKACDALAGEGGSGAQVLDLLRLFGAVDSSLARIETTLKTAQCACPEHPITLSVEPVEQAANVIPFRRFALARKTPGVA
jgi:hypothetical protein